MTVQRVFLDDWRWTVIVCYNAVAEDTGTILDLMDEAEIPFDKIEAAERILSNFQPDSGLTASSSKSRSSVCVIGRASSVFEFQNTYDHEKGHVTMHIAKALGIDPFGEELQYLAGDIGRKTYPVARMYLCAGCGNDRRGGKLPVCFQKHRANFLHTVLFVSHILNPQHCSSPRLKDCKVSRQQSPGLQKIRCRTEP